MRLGLEGRNMKRRCVLAM